MGWRITLAEYKEKGFPIEICSTCQQNTYVIHGEGISRDKNNHYTVGSCVRCEYFEKNGEIDE